MQADAAKALETKLAEAESARAAAVQEVEKQAASAAAAAGAELQKAKALTDKAANETAAARAAADAEAKAKDGALGSVERLTKERDALQGLIRTLEQKVADGSKASKTHQARAEEVGKRLRSAQDTAERKVAPAVGGAEA